MGCPHRSACTFSHAVSSQEDPDGGRNQESHLHSPRPAGGGLFLAYFRWAGTREVPWSVARRLSFYSIPICGAPEAPDECPCSLTGARSPLPFPALSETEPWLRAHQGRRQSYESALVQR